jgi:hypothetical protein
LRIIGSSSATAFGVNTRLTSFRSRSWSGGSMKMIEPVARLPMSAWASWSSVMPFVLVNVCQSRWAATTSA